ncbi:MAG: hypothetical protein ACOX9E_16160 [Lentisphaeria bacterium]
MQTSDIYHTQEIKSFKITSIRYVNGMCVMNIATKKKHRFSPNLRASLGDNMLDDFGASLGRRMTHAT